MKDYAGPVLLGWLVVWNISSIIAYFYKESMLNDLLDYLRAEKEDRFLEITDGGRYHSFWDRPSGDTLSYIFGSEDNDDELAYRYKVALKKALILQYIVMASLFVLTPIIMHFLF